MWIYQCKRNVEMSQGGKYWWNGKWMMKWWENCEELMEKRREKKTSRWKINLPCSTESIESI